MTGRHNKIKAIKAISVALSIYMTLSPMVVYADELSDAENKLSEQVETKNETVDNLKEAVENAVSSDAQVAFENIIADVDVSDIEKENTLEDTTSIVENEINNIENEAIKEAADAIVKVDMSDVDDALDTITKLVDDALTDEEVANEIETSADALIEIYDKQADAALNALKEISKESDAVSLLEDGSVSIDWNTAKKEVQDLYDAYQKALENKEIAEAAKKDATDVEKKNAAVSKVDELNSGIISNNKELNEKISASKLNKNDEINSIIKAMIEKKDSTYIAGKTDDQSVEGSNDIYRFFINTVKDGTIYGCLTYYDSENKMMLRKNFSVSADGDINYEYVPDSEWIKGDKNCKEVIFGNGGNYIAAYIGNSISTYVKNGELQGKQISDLLRGSAVQTLNSAIDDRNKALNELKEIENVAAEAEKKLQDASQEAEDALNRYKEAVALYKEVVALDSEIKNDEIEKAKLEYVKAEIEVWRRQQAVDQIKKATSSVAEADKEEVDVVAKQESIETVINTIAENLGVAPAAVEGLVAQTIIDTEDNYDGQTNNSEEAPEILTLEDNEVPLAAFDVDGATIVNMWLPILIALTGAAWLMFIVVKKNQKKETANR